MNIFLYIILFLLKNCYTAEVKKIEPLTINYTLDVDLQFDPIFKLEKTDSIYIEESSLTDEIENRHVFNYFKNSLKKVGYNLVLKEKDANIIVKVKKALKTLNFKETKRVIAEETSIVKKVYIKEKDNFQEEPKTTTKYKEIPYEYSKNYLNIEFNFYKVNDKRQINIIKASIEERVEGDFKSSLGKYINKLVEKIHLGIEIRDQRIAWIEYKQD